METMFKEWLENEYGVTPKDLTKVEYTAFYSEFVEEYSLE